MDIKSIIRKHKICSLLNSYSTLTNKEMKIVEYFNNIFDEFEEGRVYKNDKFVYCYNINFKSLQYGIYINDDLEVDCDISYIECCELVKYFFQYKFKKEVLTII